jgi:hypothetical protein
MVSFALFDVKVLTNINELRKIKEFYARIVAKETKFLEELLGIPDRPKEYVPPRLLFDSIDLNEQSAGAIFRQAIGVALAHTGFDGIYLILTL